MAFFLKVKMNKNWNLYCILYIPGIYYEVIRSFNYGTEQITLMHISFLFILEMFDSNEDALKPFSAITLTPKDM